VVERQIFCLSDQNFSPSLPCSNGECLKIMRVEDASLNEIVTGFLDLTRGKEIPTGSVILLFSATHLMLRGWPGIWRTTWRRWVGSTKCSMVG
jgi:hypothetical protein